MKNDLKTAKLDIEGIIENEIALEVEMITKNQPLCTTTFELIKLGDKLLLDDRISVMDRAFIYVRQIGPYTHESSVNDFNALVRRAIRLASAKRRGEV